MPSIDTRIVQMSFDNAKFEAGVAKTMATLAKLETSLQKVGVRNSLGDIEKAASKVTLQQPTKALDNLGRQAHKMGSEVSTSMSTVEKSGHRLTLEGPIKALGKVVTAFGNLSKSSSDTFKEVEKGADQTNMAGLGKSVDGLTAKFSLLQGAAAVALGGGIQQGVAKGTSFLKGLTVGPAIDGLHEYETNLKSIQTILANTDGQKSSGLPNVNKALQELNEYSDQTIYNFSEMAKNIGTFTAAGVDLPKATSAIKGIANLSALSGANSEQASRAMYAFSQALATGKLGLQDYNQLVNAQVGGMVFQKSIVRTAEAMGTLKKGAVEVNKETGKLTVNGISFREAIMSKPGTPSFLTDQVLVETLKQFTGDLSKGELAAKGFSAEQIKAIQQQAKVAKAAATDVKTLSQVFSVARETVGSGFAQTFQLIFGDFKEAKKTFSALSATINGFINKISDARNKMFGEWKDLGGRKLLIEGITNAFKALGALIKPITQAFRDIFPKKSGKDLFELTKRFADFTASLKPGAGIVEGLRRTFRGLFAIFHTGFEIIKGVGRVLGTLLGIAGKGSGGFLAITGSIGDFLVAIDAALTKGGLLNSFFKTLSGLLTAPLKTLSTLANILRGLFSGTFSSDSTSAAEGLGKIGEAGKKISPIIERLKRVWDGLVRIFNDAKELVGPWLKEIGEGLGRFGDIIANAIETADFSKVMEGLQTGFIGAIFLTIKNAIGGGIGGGLVDILDDIRGIFSGLTGTLKTMQNTLQAASLTAIGIAIGTIAASTYAISKIDSDKLATAMTAIAVGLGQLIAGLKFMAAGLSKGVILMLPLMAAGLIGVAIAVNILALAMKLFATMDWEELGKGLAGVGGALVSVGLGIKAIGPATVIQGPALIALALALNLLAIAVRQFADMEWEAMGRGITGLFMALAALAVPLATLGPAVVLVGPGLIAASLGMSLLAGAVLAFGSIDSNKMVSGLIGLFSALVLIGSAVTVFPPTLPLTAAGLILLSIALTGIATAIGIMGKLKVLTMVKGIIGIGGALLVLAGGLSLMSGTIAGSAALLLAATALSILAPTLGFLGTLKFTTIATGLIAIATVLGTLSVVGAVASGGLVALGVALLPLAGVFVLTAAGVFLLAQAMHTLAGKGSKGVNALVAAIIAFLTALPTIVIQFVKGLVDILEGFVTVAPKVFDALTKIFADLIQFVLDNIGPFSVAFGALVDAAILAIIEYTPKIIKAAFHIIQSFLSGIDQNLPSVIAKGTSIIIKFLSGMAAKAPALTEAGAKFVTAFLNGIAQHIGDVVRSALNVVLKFLNTIIAHIPKFVSAGARAIGGFLRSIANQLPGLISAGAKVVIKFVDGISSQFGNLVKAATRMVTRLVSAFADEKNIKRLVDAGFDAAINIINGVAEALRSDENIPRLVDAAINLGAAIVEGIVKGLLALPAALAKRLFKPIESAFNGVKGFLGIKSPSTVFMALGKHIVDGMGLGLISMKRMLNKSITSPIAEMIRENSNLGEFGKFLGTEFKDGILGNLFGDGKSDVQKTVEGTFNTLKDKLKAEQAELRDQIKADEDKLSQELGKERKDRNQKLIASLAHDIFLSKELLKDATIASGKFSKALSGAQSVLISLGDQYVSVSDRLKEAQTALDEAVRARDDAYKSFTDQFNQTPDVSNLVSDAFTKAMMTEEERQEAIKKEKDEAEKRRRINQVALYKKALEEQIKATQKYNETLAKLRALGLDDTTYKKLLSMGTAGQEFASQLLKGGPREVAAINALDAQLLNSAQALAANATNSLYQAGVDAAQGLVNGLAAQQQAIEAIMTTIATNMVNTIKAQLGIRSPARVLMKVGEYVAQGVVVGLNANTQNVARAAQGLGDEVITNLQNSMNRMGDVMSLAGIDTEPRITPVLDLTNVKKGAGELQGIKSKMALLTPAESFSMATSIASEKEAVTTEAAEAAAATTGPVVTLEQNNYSPEALSAVEIYRQTNNQLAQARSALGLPTTT